MRRVSIRLFLRAAVAAYGLRAVTLAAVVYFAPPAAHYASAEPYDSDTPGTMDDRMPGTLPDERRPGAMQDIPVPGSMPVERKPGIIGTDDERGPRDLRSGMDGDVEADARLYGRERPAARDRPDDWR